MARAGVGIALLVVGVGCGGVPWPRVIEIETITSGDTTLSFQRLEIRYAGDQIAEAWFSADGVDLGRWVAEYRDGVIKKLDQYTADDEAAGAVTFDTDNDGRPRQVIATAPSGDSLRRDFTYVKDQISKVEFTDTRRDPLTAEVVITNWTDLYRYDKKGRPDRLTREGLAEPEITTFGWNNDGALQGVTRSVAGVDATDSFAYDDQQRLNSVSTAGQLRYALVYGDDGPLSQTELTLGNDRSVARYFYADGEVAGVRPSPLVPHGELFDLEGSVVERVDFLNFGLFE